MEQQKGFSLVELLIVVGIIAILSGAAVVTINPVERLREARDTQRAQEIDSIDKTLKIIQTLGNSTSMGSSSVVYVSMPDTSTTCANLGLPDLPSGWAYECASTSTYLNADGTGWLPVNLQDSGIAQLSRLPTDPINATSSGFYYIYITDGSAYKISAPIESIKYVPIAKLDGGSDEERLEKGGGLTLAPFINNWVWVPGSSLYSTSPGFFVMKYEAKYDKNSDGKGDDATGCVADTGDSYDWRDCGSGGTLVTTPEGSPIAHITFNQARAECQALGADLITNDQWMTIVRNVDQQTQNWSGGSVGSGCIFRGNTNLDDACGYDGADPEKGTSRNSKAILSLSTGHQIYDFAGNVWEYVMLDSSGTLIDNQPIYENSDIWQWREYFVLTGYGDFGSWDNLLPSDTGWDSTNGIGTIYHYDGTDPGHVLFRGGSYSSDVGSGVVGLYLGWTPDNAGLDRGGFRCAK